MSAMKHRTSRSSSLPLFSFSSLLHPDLFPHPLRSISAVKKSLKESVEFHCSSWQGTGNAYYTIIALI